MTDRTSRARVEALGAAWATHGQPGTARYMSPEQAEGLAADHRIDLFSAGLVLYEAPTGEPLIETTGNASAIEVRMRVAAWQGFHDDTGLPEQLGDVLIRSLARDPADRVENAAAMGQALSDLRTEDDVPRGEEGGVSWSSI